MQATKTGILTRMRYFTPPTGIAISRCYALIEGQWRVYLSGIHLKASIVTNKLKYIGA
jgi:hypothetical protein